MTRSLTLLYALGKYTPVFHWLYDFLPGVMLYRRPADATFVFCGLLAMIAGYLIHRFLTGTMPAARPLQRVAEIAVAIGVAALAGELAWRVGVLASTIAPLLWGAAFIATAIATTQSAAMGIVTRRRNTPIEAQV